MLQTDGYAGYNKVCRENTITRIGCWDHARRKFVEASKAAPTKKRGQKVSKADVAIGKIRKLYRIEDKIKDLTPAQKTEQREQLSRPVLDDLKAWLKANSRRVPKDSLTAKAIQYTLNQWDYLVGYCDDGHLHISNALAENAIRPFAVGRRNWLFADTARGAKASATCYSLIETAKANGLEPYAYSATSCSTLLQLTRSRNSKPCCLGTRPRTKSKKADSLALTLNRTHKTERRRSGALWGPSFTHSLGVKHIDKKDRN